MFRDAMESLQLDVIVEAEGPPSPGSRRRSRKISISSEALDMLQKAVSGKNENFLELKLTVKYKWIDSESNRFGSEVVLQAAGN